MLSNGEDSVKPLRPKFQGQIQRSQTTHSSVCTPIGTHYTDDLGLWDLALIECALINRQGRLRIALRDAGDNALLNQSIEIEIDRGEKTMEKVRRLLKRRY